MAFNWKQGVPLKQEEIDALQKPQQGFDFSKGETVQPASQTFSERVGGALEQRRETLRAGKLSELQGKQTPLETGVQVIGAGIGGTYDIALEGLKSIGNVISKITPDFIEKPVVEGVKLAAKKMLDANPPLKAGLEALRLGKAEFEKFRQSNPDLANRIERDADALFNIVSVLPVEKVLGVGGKVVSRGAGELAGKVAGRVEAGLEKQFIEETANIVKKEALTTAEKEAALREGRVVGNKIIPSEQDLKIAEASQGIVNPKNVPEKNIASLGDEIARLGKENIQMAKDTPVIFNDKTLKSFITKNRQEYAPLFTSEVNADKTYEATVGKFFEILSKYKNNPEGALMARQEFDKYIERTFGEKYLGGPVKNARQAGIKDVRNGVNDFIADTLPEGNALKSNLQRQTLLYRGIDNIAEKSASAVGKGKFEILTQKVSGFIHKHPLGSAVGSLALGGGLTAATLLGALTNPITLSLLVTTGTIALGKKVLTSKMAREGLVKILKIAEKTLSSEEISGIKGIIENLKD